MGKVYIIAEAGVNHNGSLELAKQLVDAAKSAGADCVKFQTFISENLVSQFAEKAAYQKLQTDEAENQQQMLKKLELSFHDFKELKDYCNEKQIHFLSTPFDMESIEFLDSLDMGCWKIPSGEITNLPYLERIAITGKKVILSTGMATMQEIEEAVRILKHNNCTQIALLHCTTEYPAPFGEVNLMAMHSLREEFHVEVGYSDHTRGIEIPVAAVAMGATIIEKHFTLDKNMDGPDHKASLEPNELKTMVESIRNVEAALGDGVKCPTQSEKKNKQVARKSIVAARNIKAGEKMTQDNITVKRPGTGISPMKWYDVLGQKAIKDFEKDELIIL